MQKVRGAAWAGVVVAGVLGLGACTGDDPVPPVTSSGPTSSTGSPTQSDPTIAAPQRPSDANQESDRGAMALVRHFFALSNYAYQSGDVGPLQELSDPSCGGCTELIDAVRESTSDGSTFSGERYALISVNAPAPQAGKAIVAVAFERPAIVRHYPDGTTATTQATPAERVRFRLGWVDDHWSVEAIGT